MPDVIAVLGTGIMGLPMARNAAKSGLTVRAWNRTHEKALPLAEHGVEVFERAEEAVDGADLVVTMLLNGEAVLDVARNAMQRPSLWVQQSTIGLDAAAQAARLAEERGITLIDAPVLGTKAPAEAGKLIHLAAGPDDAIDRALPYLDAVGARTMRVPDGQRLKLVCNFWVLTLVEGLGEVMALAEGLAVDPRDFLSAIEGGALDCQYAHLKGDAMINRTFTPPSFELSGAAKDAGLIADASRIAKLDLPLARTIADRMAAGVADHGHLDMSATFLTSFPRALAD